MYIYFIPILSLFFLSKYRISKKTERIILFLLMIFLCFGYMTGSDWRTYETDYVDGFTHRLVEPGYMFISNSASSLGINFWAFHIFFKCLSFILIVQLIDKLCNRNPFFALALWYASYGLFLFINCPFRNVIACGIGALAIIQLLDKRVILFYTLSALAMTFHLSAIILLILPICRFERFSSKLLVTLYLGLLAILLIVGSGFVYNILSALLPSFLLDRLGFYTESNGSLLSFGLIPRLICLYLLITYRYRIARNNKYGSAVFSMAYTSLLVSLIYYAFPMLFRSALFLSPFYVVAIFLGLQEMNIKYKSILRLCISFIFLAVVYTTVRSVYYVPYTNIIDHAITGKLYDYEYRDNYNFTYSPYREKLPN